MASASLKSLHQSFTTDASGVEAKMCFLKHGNELKRKGKKDEESGKGEALYGRGMMYLDGQARPNAKLKLQIHVTAENFFFFVREAQ
ncbi:hypothetical protein BTUL_0045g00470 [Botrytis tulipae]|uniref:Uncharacterized protein n=1 Tax=Botrytis tulipae TaxID=87230 RepID=A0A4Z1F1S6_9HELO|nr:hypothetical protein BTUL_0045g00470 [Botrytis tulipae]